MTLIWIHFFSMITLLLVMMLNWNSNFSCNDNTSVARSMMTAGGVCVECPAEH